MKASNPILLVLGVGFLISSSGYAAMVTYADFASWSAAAGATSTVSIPDPSPSPFLNLPSGGVTYGGVNFSSSAPDAFFFVVGPGFGANPAVVSDQGASAGDAENILITLPSFVNAFAVNYGTFGGGTVSFTLSNADNTSQPSTAGAYGTPDFFGVTDTTAFNSVLLETNDAGNAPVLNVNNVSAQGIGGVPEPGSWLLLISGGLGLLALKRK